MFIVGPYMVPSDASKEQLLYFWYVWAAATGIILLASIVYLPSQPPSPPSRSASTTRTDFAGGFRAILSCTRKGSKEDNTPARARGFWLITAAYGIVTGVYGGWGSILALNCENFKQLDHPEVTAGWLGFWSTLAGCVGGVGFALYIDRGAVAARKKWLLLVLSILSGACFLVFSLMVSTDFIAFRPWLLYATNIVGGLLVNGQIPLFYEAGVEVM
jgi:FLVCR family MFS transporter